MNKLYFGLSLFLFLSIRSAAQEEGLYQFTHSYFRSDPFQSQFSHFMEHLMKDPGITGKKIRLRSDTSLFYFYGTYTNYNPFFFKPKRVEVILEEMPFRYEDSLQAHDTILVYQLIAYGEDSEKGLKEIKREFEKMHRQYKRRFFDSNYKEFEQNNTVIGGIHNYFVPLHGLSPLSVAWGRLDDSGDPVLNIVLRIKTSENQAVLPVPLYNSK
ncbi:MAG: hypothetical protein E6Q24_00785 [Chitinophagaceae bacterium]|jgi:hypothetical protein|nr:hypothetical protein [Sphingobacteriales bacterium]OJW04572.1 MAG: hypothetical protein BGO52_18820 [Sphingobacteriales bacterium 44-61]TXJ29780.1 MAG: hypothetical protein E6Q24_00785 [Chitinophagaceae bacterium]